MSLSKKDKALQETSRAAVIAAITEHGAMTGKELMAALPMLKKGMLPSMVKYGHLESRESGRSDRNGTRFMLYALPGKECKRVEVEPGPTLFDLWPVSVPNVSGKPRKVEEKHSYGSAIFTAGIQSSALGLIIFGG